MLALANTASTSAIHDNKHLFDDKQQNQPPMTATQRSKYDEHCELKNIEVPSCIIPTTAPLMASSKTTPFESVVVSDDDDDDYDDSSLNSNENVSEDEEEEELLNMSSITSLEDIFCDGDDATLRNEDAIDDEFEDLNDFDWSHPPEKPDEPLDFRTNTIDDDTMMEVEIVDFVTSSFVNEGIVVGPA